MSYHQFCACGRILTIEEMHSEQKLCGRCLEKKKCEKVMLQIDLHEYKFIAVTASRHKDTIRKLGINELLKNDLVKDINIITSILGKSEFKLKQEVSGG